MLMDTNLMIIRVIRFIEIKSHGVDVRPIIVILIKTVTMYQCQLKLRDENSVQQSIFRTNTQQIQIIEMTYSQ